MLDFVSAEHADLRTETSPWITYPDLRSGEAPAVASCGVLVVGGGITGALSAEHLTALGHDVVLIDREPPGRGSTAASTAMLQWEIDAPLLELADLHGWEPAADIYRRSFKAVEGLTALVRALGLDCRFRQRSTLYLAGGDAGYAELAREHELRKRAGLPGELLSGEALFSHFRLNRPGAIWSQGSADVEPACLTHELLLRAKARGARIWSADAVAFQHHSDSVLVQLAGGGQVEAGHVLLATGYVMPDIVPKGLHKIATSYAFVTEPQLPGSLWPEEALLWEASDSYSYARTTAEGRIVFGGEDEPGHDPKEAELKLPAKIATLGAKLRALWPTAHLKITASWAGAFGETPDGLPLIGRVPGHPRMLAAYGYGGNGITFSFMASRILAALIRGEERPWFEPFAIDRAVAA